MAKSLKKRIDELINALGSADKPTYPQIKSRLIRFSALAEELEQGKPIRELEKKVATLDAAYKVVCEENAELEVQLEKTNAEITRLRADEKEREKKDDDLPDIEFEILKALPSKSEPMIRGRQIAEHLGIDIGDVDLYLEKLEGLGYAARVGHSWQRTNKANAFILAKRLAAEGQTDSENQSLDDPDELPRP